MMPNTYPIRFRPEPLPVTLMGTNTNRFLRWALESGSSKYYTSRKQRAIARKRKKS